VEQPNSKTKLWLYFAGIAVIIIMMAATRWSLDHPFGTNWDESEYINEVLIDAQRLEHGMILKLGGRIMVKSYGRPPAYRPLALPFLLAFGLHPASARLMCVACFGLSAWLIFLATRRIDSDMAGAFAVLVFAVSPTVVAASSWLSTEGPLYLATAAMLYYMFAGWTGHAERTSNWIGLGLSVGLGFLAKASFAAIALPALAFWLVAGRRANLEAPSLRTQLKAGALALIVAAPWWILNLRFTIAYAQYARDYSAHSLGPPTLATWAKWFNTVLQCLLGHGLSILLGLVAIAWFRRSILKKESLLDPLQRLALGVCGCAGLPIILAQLSGTNHLLRHISPAMIPLAIAVGVLADTTGWIGSPAGAVMSVILLSGQLLVIVVPAIFPSKHVVVEKFVTGEVPWEALARRDQWDWRPLQSIADRCGREAPTISYLGLGPGLDPPYLEDPWVEKVTLTSRAIFDLPEVKWLWRYEEGPLDWQQVIISADQSDIVLAAPTYHGTTREDELDNQYNAEFADRLSRDSRFQGPIDLKVGRFQPIDVEVYLNKRLACQPAPR